MRKIVRTNVVKLPTEVSLTITKLLADGLGFAEVVDETHGHTKTFHVRNALPGETVRARILRRRKGILQTDAVQVEDDHSVRQRSACVNFPRCGGCSMHHMQPSAQLALKQQQLELALAENDVEPGGWSEPYSAVRLGYRRKARLGVRKLGDQVLVGFRESFSNRVARITTCEVLTPELSKLIGPLRQLIAQLSIADKIPQIEVAQGDGPCVLMVRHLEPLTPEDMEHWSFFEKCHGVVVLLQSAGYDSLVPLPGGRGEKVKRLGYHILQSGLYLEFIPQQFTQVNQAMNEVLIRRVLMYLGDLNGRRVVDLFCGIGNFTLPLAKAGAQVWGYEVAADAIGMAQENSENNSLAHRTNFETLDLYSEHAQQGLPTSLDALVLDPPRSGAGPNLQGWLDSFTGADIVYVSCNPKSFALDAAVIVAQGFVLDKVGIFDMFPNTAHIETVGHFKRQSRHG